MLLLQGMLDYLDHLNVGQIRKLYCVLSVLAFRDPQAQGMLQVIIRNLNQQHPL